MASDAQSAAVVQDIDPRLPQLGHKVVLGKNLSINSLEIWRRIQHFACFVTVFRIDSVQNERFSSVDL